MKRHNLQSLLTIFLICLLPALHSSPLESESKEPKQGILEIPKQAASLIRNYIDSRLQTYLNLTTPKPDPAVPPELTSSILGHLLLGNLFNAPATAQPYNPAAILNINSSPIYASSDPSYENVSKPVETKPTTTPAPPTQPPPPPPETTKKPVLHYRTNKPTQQYKVRPTNVVPAVVSSSVEDDERTTPLVLVNYGAPPKRNRTAVTSRRPGTQTFEIRPVVVQGEGFWVDDATRQQVIIPIETTTTRISSTTDEDEEEETDVDEARTK